MAVAAHGPLPFEGRTVHLVSDLTLREQLYLYEKTRLLKQHETAKEASEKALLSGCTPTHLDLKNNPQKCAVYLIFCEESTRTKDSFRNAAVFHQMDVNEISDAKSLFKKETVADVVKMLASYSTKKSLFVIRSPMEGVCRWLENAMGSGFGPQKPCFLNAGDGRHTHPTLEYVDVYTLLEINNFDRSEIHIALVGDLQNGRTAHSKVDGLKIFEKVTVDLISPQEIAYPVEYKMKMKANGFTVREFTSIEEYLAQNDKSTTAKVWSFSRLQISRIGEELHGREEDLYKAVVFKAEWRSRLPEGVKFLQTLPRDPTHPLIPYSFDGDSINAYERASSNGYWVRITLLGMVMGLLGQDFIPQSPKPSDLVPTLGAGDMFQADFITKVLVKEKTEPETKGPIHHFEKGVVIDHILRGASNPECWALVDSIRKVMHWMSMLGSHGVHHGEGDDKVTKGVIAIPDFNFASWQTEDLKKLAALSPGCTVNIIEGFHVKEKYRLATPTRIYNIPNVQCKNISCVSNHNQPDVWFKFHLHNATHCKETYNFR